MMNKQEQSSFSSLVVTPSLMGVACCPSVVVTLSLVSHKAKAKSPGSKILAQGEVKLLRNCFHTPGSDSPRLASLGQFRLAKSLALSTSVTKEALEGVKSPISHDH